MSEPLTFKTSYVDASRSGPSLTQADTDGNGSLFDATDRLPRVTVMDGGKPESGALLLDPVIDGRYRAMKRGTGKAPDLVRPVLMQDAGKATIHPEEIVEMMRRNGGHPIRMGDLAWLFPAAKIRGEGASLSDIAAVEIKTQAFPGGVKLADAFVDPSGEIIVSPFYANELKTHAPKFAQFFTRHLKGDGPDECYSREAFGLEACEPDSWPVDLDTLLGRASLDLHRYDGADRKDESHWMSRTLLDRRRALLDALAGFAKTDRTGLIKVPLRGDGARAALKFLNDRFAGDPSFVPALLCDPDDATQIAFHLGVPPSAIRVKGGRIDDRDLRKALVAILDDRKNAVSYTEAEANRPALFNKDAGAPSLHFIARVSPKDLGRVIFGVYHIDAQSYLPRGNYVAGGIDSRNQYRHQGESEPVYLSFRREGATLKPLKAYVGEHFTADPVAFEDYEKGTLAVGYASGARMFLGESRRYEPASMLSRGVKSTAFEGSLSSPFFGALPGLLPSMEIFPGKKDVEGPKATAAVFAPHAGPGAPGPSEYRIIVEGEGGDFLPTGRLLTRNGEVAATANNTSGYPFVRGSRAIGASNDGNRMQLGLYDFTERMDRYQRDRQLGKIGVLRVDGGIAGTGRRLRVAYAGNSLVHLDHAVETGPLSKLVFGFSTILAEAGRAPYLPPVSAQLLRMGDAPWRGQLGLDLAEIQLGVGLGDFYVLPNARVEAGLLAGPKTAAGPMSLGGALTLAAGTRLLYQVNRLEFGASHEYATPLLRSPLSSPATHVISFGAGFRFETF